MMFPKYHYTSSLIYRFMKRYGIGSEVLDIGCGSGVLSEKAKEINPGCKITCADIDPDAITATQSAVKDADVYLSDLMENVPEKAYDTILANLNPYEMERLLRMKHQIGCMIYCVIFKEVSDIYIEDLGYEIIDHTDGYEFNAFVLKCK